MTAATGEGKWRSILEEEAEAYMRQLTRDEETKQETRHARESARNGQGAAT